MDAIKKALAELVAKLDEINAHPSTSAVFTSAFAHGVLYKGPNYKAELEAARSALSGYQPTEGETAHSVKIDFDKYLPFADQPTPKPQAGTWRLVAPDGREFTGESPIHCVGAESKSRIPPEVALGRIARSLHEDCDDEAAPSVTGEPDVEKSLKVAIGTLQRAGHAAGLLAGSDLFTELVPAIERMHKAAATIFAEDPAIKARVEWYHPDNPTSESYLTCYLDYIPSKLAEGRKAGDTFGLYLAPQPIATLRAAPPPPMGGEPVALKLAGIDEYGPRLEWSKHWTEFAIGTKFYTSPMGGAAEGPKPKFTIGDEVRKVKGSQWHGRVVGTYSTALTPEGYAVESSTEKGSVQIYPAAALELAAAPKP